MRLIAHRGNINGPNPETENNPNYVSIIIGNGFDVEIDVWYIKNQLWLGHDYPQYKIDESYLKNDKLWCHAKSITSFNHMLEIGNIHCFFHQNDDVTLTSQGFLWTYPGKELTKNSICVMPERISKSFLEDTYNCYGICTDYVSDFRLNYIL
jgi:hypothetical protein